MNTRTKILAYTVTAALAAAFSSQAFAREQERPKPGQRRQFAQLQERARPGQGQRSPDQQFDAIFKELNLTPEQQQKISGQRSRQQKEREALREKMSALRKELTVELNKEKTDRIRVKALIAQIKELIGARIQSRVEGILAVKEVLTPEQFKKLNEKMNRFEFRKGGKNEKTGRHYDPRQHPRCRIRCYKFCQRLG